jgi:hypothetical protein
MATALLIDDMLTMAPAGPPFFTFSTISRAAAWPHRNWPFRLTRMTRSKSSSECRGNRRVDDAGIVDEDVDVAEDVERRGHEIVHGEPVADIGADEADLAERGRQVLLGAVPSSSISAMRRAHWRRPATAAWRLRSRYPARRR